MGFSLLVVVVFYVGVFNWLTSVLVWFFYSCLFRPDVTAMFVFFPVPMTISLIKLINNKT